MIFSAIGLLMTLLVAWGLALIPHMLGPGNMKFTQLVWPRDDGTQGSVYYNEQRWFGVLEEQFHITRRGRARTHPNQISIWWAWSPFLPRTNAIETSQRLFDSFSPPQPDTSVISVTQAGFPALALRCESLVDDSAPLADGTFPTTTRGAFFDRIDAAALAGKPAVWPHAERLWLPYHPVWSGLIINTVFYAILAFLFASLIRSVMHARRMHRGRCPYCAYELGFNFSDGCPECGWRHSGTKTA